MSPANAPDVVVGEASQESADRPVVSPPPRDGGLAPTSSTIAAHDSAPRPLDVPCGRHYSRENVEVEQEFGKASTPILVAPMHLLLLPPRRPLRLWHSSRGRLCKTRRANGCVALMSKTRRAQHSPKPGGGGGGGGLLLPRLGLHGDGGDMDERGAWCYDSSTTSHCCFVQLCDVLGKLNFRILVLYLLSTPLVDPMSGF